MTVGIITVGIMMIAIAAVMALIGFTKINSGSSKWWEYSIFVAFILAVTGLFAIVISITMESESKATKAAVAVCMQNERSNQEFIDCLTSLGYRVAK
jgi:high-affinity K+ transport system ATPase subunit B